jgi:ribosomal protein S6--L-glutamate ligase
MRRARAGGLRVAILGDPAGWHVGRLRRALTARGHHEIVVRWAELAAEVGTATPPPAAAGGERFQPGAVDAADVVLVRSMPGGGLEEVIFRMDLLGRLAARGTPVVNAPRALEIAIDKYLSLTRLAAAGLPVPRTIVAQDPATIRAAWESFCGDCITKPLFGSQGRGLLRLADRSAIDAVIAAVTDRGPEGASTYLQEFVPHQGWDVRVLVIGNRSISIRRVAAGGDWRTNVSCGGRPEAFDAPAEWVDLANRAAEAVGAEVAGVDLLPAQDGRLLVLEVNAVPGWRGLESATGVDVGDAVIRHLENRAATSADAT